MTSTRTVAAGRRLALLFALAASLAGCGGDGTDAAPAVAPAPAPAPAPGPAPPPGTAAPGISLLVGTPSGRGNRDGQGRSAYFGGPGGFGGLGGMARSADGSLLVTDLGNATLRRVTPDGTVRTLIGINGVRGIVDGPATIAQLNRPGDVAAAPNDGAYFIDIAQPTAEQPRVGPLLRHMSPGGTVTTLQAPPGIVSVATNAAGQVVVATETGVYAWSASGSMLLAGHASEPGTADGPSGEARFAGIADVALAADGTVYVSEPRTHRLRRVRGAQVDTLAGAVDAPATVDGIGAAARLNRPHHLSLDSQQRVWVADVGSGHFRLVTPEGAVSTPFGADRALFAVALAAGASGDLFFSSFAGVNRLDASGGLTPVAGQDFVTGTLSEVQGIGVDGGGNIVVKQALAPPGPASQSYSVTRYNAAGQPVGSPASLPASFAEAQGFAVGADGSAYSSSVFTTSAGINAFSATGGAITRIAPDGGTSELMRWPASAPGGIAPGYLTLGRDGAFYFIDLVTFNIVRWTPAAGAQVLASVPGFNLFFSSPRALTADAQGRVHLVTTRGVQRVQNGALVNVAGDFVGGQAGNSDGAGTAARFTGARSAAVDAAGNLYIADGELVRRMTPEGMVTTVAGTRGVVGLTAGGLPGTLSPTTNVAVGSDGALYVVSGTAIVKIQP